MLNFICIQIILLRMLNLKHFTNKLLNFECIFVNWSLVRGVWDECFLER